MIRRLRRLAEKGHVPADAAESAIAQMTTTQDTLTTAVTIDVAVHAASERLEVERSLVAGLDEPSVEES